MEFNGVYTQNIRNTDEAARILSKMIRDTLNGVDDSPVTITLPREAIVMLYEWLVKIGVCPEGWKYYAFNEK